MPANPLEWSLAVPAGLAALAIPVALVVWMWPVIVAAGAFGVAVLGVTLAAGLFISTVFLWLFAPLVTLMAVLVAGFVSAMHGLYRLTAR